MLSVTVTEAPAILTDADTKIKEVQIENNKIKQQLLLIKLPFFLRDLTCMTRIQVMLKL